MKLYIKDRKLKNFLFVGWNVTWQSWPSVLCKSFHINPLIPSNVHHKSDFKEQQRWLPTLNILQRGVGHFYLGDQSLCHYTRYTLHFTLYCFILTLQGSLMSTYPLSFTLWVESYQYFCVYRQKMTPIRTKQLQSVWSKSNESQTKKLRQKLYRNYTGIIQGEVFMQILDSRMTIVS